VHIKYSMDGELCVLPSGVNSMCVNDTAIRQAYYYTATTTNTANTWVILLIHGTGIYSQQYRSFL